MDLEEPPKKKRRPLLSLRRSVKFPLHDSTNRFPQPTSEEEFLKAAEGVVPSNTKQNSRWAMCSSIQCCMSFHTAHMPNMGYTCTALSVPLITPTHHTLSTCIIIITSGPKLPTSVYYQITNY